MRTVVPGLCPCCNTAIEYLYQTENIPYFSDILLISANCASCGYRFVDTQLLTHREPMRYVLRVEHPEDLAVRVVRSMSAAIEIPELGVRIDPGPACQGFVSNVEGVLDRIGQIVEGALLWGEAEERKNATRLLERIAAAKEPVQPFTLILEDPSGNSAIVSDKAEKCTFALEGE